MKLSQDSIAFKYLSIFVTDRKRKLKNSKTVTKSTTNFKCERLMTSHSHVKCLRLKNDKHAQTCRTREEQFA